MELFALVGKSGSGKSYKSHVVAGTYNIEYVIDDGLLIKGNKIVAGISAKRERTKFGAVRRAIFSNPTHRDDVKNALEVHKPQRLMIIGTSEHMIQNIIEALDLVEDYKLIKIEEISTKEEIDTAFHIRRTKGKHVIPVPTFEVKKAFSGYFIDSIRHWARKGDSKSAEMIAGATALQQSHLQMSAANAINTNCSSTMLKGNSGSGNGSNDVGHMGVITETTVVRPTFSYLGSYEIKDGAIKEIISESAIEAEGVMKANSINLKNESDGIRILVTVTLKCKNSIPETVNKMADTIKRNVEHMTGLNVLEINTIVKALVH